MSTTTRANILAQRAQYIAARAEAISRHDTVAAERMYEAILWCNERLAGE